MFDADVALMFHDSRPAMNTEILSTHTPALFSAAVKRAAELLRAGEVVALPTETVYGLAANALDAKAVAKIFQIKGRPANNPIIVHVAGNEMAKRCVENFPPLAEKLSKSFWPGPLTLVLPRAKKIPDNVTAGGETVGIRWPSHPFIQAVIRECGFPLAAPSANLSNQISPTNAEHVRAQLGGKIPLIVDGGQSQVGIESTVLDLTVSPPQILRPGMIHAESLAAVVGRNPTSNIQNPKSRMLAKSRLAGKTLFAESETCCFELARRCGFAFSTFNLQLSTFNLLRHRAHENSIRRKFRRRERDAARRGGFCARALRGTAPLRRGGREIIVVEAPPDSPEWSGIADRLRRAAA